MGSHKISALLLTTARSRHSAKPALLNNVRGSAWGHFCIKYIRVEVELYNGAEGVCKYFHLHGHLSLYLLTFTSWVPVNRVASDIYEDIPGVKCS